jgi:H/ACA ribonucleoprotein complex non-core subunit NAF1
LREFRFIEHDADADDDYDDAQAANPAGVYLRTKNELQEVDFPVPDTQKVGPTEILEKVGVVLSIVDNAVIVKGNAADNAGKASERALDSETLLVFENRDVLGYVSNHHSPLNNLVVNCVQVYETFGPTSQPLYQVKFDERFPLDQEKVRVAREVFHVPQRSNFVFLSQIKHFKGSDASNVNDEEPAEDEIEFSDDEQEAAFKSSRKQR